MKKSQISLLTVSVSVASLLLASSTAIANGKYKENYKDAPCPVVLTLKDGFYVGLQGGYDMYRIASDIPENGYIVDPLLEAGFNADPIVFAGGGVGGGFLGYGKYFDTLYAGAYLGLEIFGNWSGADVHSDIYVSDFDGTTVPSTTNRYHTHTKVTSNYGIDVLPGLKLNPATLFYVRLGYNWANFKVDEEFTSAWGTPAAVSHDFDGESNNVGGFHYGVGIESTFMDNWSVRAEYTHTDFNNINTDGEISLPDGTLVSAPVSEFTPAGNQFLLGVLYHFNM